MTLLGVNSANLKVKHPAHKRENQEKAHKTISHLVSCITSVKLLKASLLPLCSCTARRPQRPDVGKGVVLWCYP